MKGREKDRRERKVRRKGKWRNMEDKEEIKKELKKRSRLVKGRIETTVEGKND